MIRAPSAAKRSACSRPCPRATPVMNTTLWSNRALLFDSDLLFAADLSFIVFPLLVQSGERATRQPKLSPLYPSLNPAATSSPAKRDVAADSPSTVAIWSLLTRPDVTSPARALAHPAWRSTQSGPIGLSRVSRRQHDHSGRALIFLGASRCVLFGPQQVNGSRLCELCGPESLDEVAPSDLATLFEKLEHRVDTGEPTVDPLSKGHLPAKYSIAFDQLQCPCHGHDARVRILVQQRPDQGPSSRPGRRAQSSHPTVHSGSTSGTRSAARSGRRASGAAATDTGSQRCERVCCHHTGPHQIPQRFEDCPFIRWNTCPFRGGHQIGPERGTGGRELSPDHLMMWFIQFMAGGGAHIS